MKEKYIKSPMNYIGNKYRILNQLHQYFPKDIDAMVDLFCGGCDVSINTPAITHYANDINYHVIDIFKEFQKHSTEYILDYIDATISKWNLSKTNVDAFLSFREFYNQTKNPLDLYVLMCFSFNYQVRFNSKHEYNGSFGKNKAEFTSNMRSNLINFMDKITGIKFSSNPFQFFDFTQLSKGDFLYADPPYLITCGSYNDGKRGFTGWGNYQERTLYGILTDLDKCGIKFALSNVMEHKGIINNILYVWVKTNDYNIYDINVKYDHSNYQSKNVDKGTREVLITNY